MSHILELLKLQPSPQSIDFVRNKRAFHLHTLLTEQRHSKTWNLSHVGQTHPEAALGLLLSVDRDIVDRVEEIAADPGQLERAVQAVIAAALSGHKVYVYGCGATGRLAKQMESTFWRPIWKKIKRRGCWKMLESQTPPNIEDSLIGEMTGGDRALVSSLEGFEDLQLMGKLQLEDHAIVRDDVVFCVTEGGETSSVIGALHAALDQYGCLDDAQIEAARRHLYFIYNNPDEQLLPFQRSASLIGSPAITRINLRTGPQAIAGSTRMQATTIATFVIGIVLEEAITRILSAQLPLSEVGNLGFRSNLGLPSRLLSLEKTKSAVDAATSQLARLTQLETDTYRRGRRAIYFAKSALITVFIDNTERSPTFRLHPLDPVMVEKRRCWVQVWTEASDQHEAWQSFLGRPFRGLNPSRYRAALETQVPDSYLREAALRSLGNAGDDQELRYDFSFSQPTICRSGPQEGDLGVLVLMDEELLELENPSSRSRRFADLVLERKAHLALILVIKTEFADAALRSVRKLYGNEVIVPIALNSGDDPLGVHGQIALKMLLNAHSTGIMAALGRVIGNTMTSVSPSNLKLIGRASFLILSHVNDILKQRSWIDVHGSMAPITYSEANAVLFDAMDYVRTHDVGETAEVALSIIRITESLERRDTVSWEEAHDLLAQGGLDEYLTKRNPSLQSDAPSPQIRR